MRLCCKRCYDLFGRLTPAPMLRDPWGRAYETRCDDCNEGLAERQAVSDFEAYHGGAIVTDAQRMDAAYAARSH